MNKKRWDDIPSLEGLEVDWQYQPFNPQGKRAFVRVSERDLLKMFDGQPVKVKIATSTATLTGSLLDICKGGMDVALKVALAENEAIKVGFFLGTQKITSRAEVRNVRRCDQEYAIGIRFVDLDAVSRIFIAGIYASRVLKHAL